MVSPGRSCSISADTPGMVAVRLVWFMSCASGFACARAWRLLCSCSGVLLGVTTRLSSVILFVAYVVSGVCIMNGFSCASACVAFMRSMVVASVLNHFMLLLLNSTI